jgi:hypothetical protein
MATLPEPGATYTPARVQRELSDTADQLERLDARRRELEARRKAWLIVAKTLPDPDRPGRTMGYRTVARWARITNPRAHQILGPSAPD